MNETALQNALARREKILQELERLDAFIELYHELSGSPSGDRGIDAVLTARNGQKTYFQVKKHQRLRPRSLAPLVREILLKQGCPMTRTQLTEALKAKGVNMPSADEARYLGTVLWRHRNEFVNIEGEGYWPRDTLCQAVAYVPDEIREAIQSAPPEGGQPH